MPLTAVPLNMLDASSGDLGFRNLIINGDCRTAQRGATALGGAGAWTYGGCDRILVSASGFTTSSGTINQIASGTSTSTGFAQSVVVTTTGTGTVQFSQRIEAANIRHLAGKQVTISAKLYHDAGSAVPVAFQLYKANTLDNFSGAATQIGTTVSVGNAASGAYTTVQATFTLSAADAATGLWPVVQFTPVGAVTGRTFAIGDFQMEMGAAATPFEVRPIGTELALCQRYYEVGGGVTATAIATGGIYPQFFFKVTKRAASTITNSRSVAVAGDAVNYWYQNSNDGASNLMTWTASAEL